jgi:hypothetical protein
MALTPDQCMQPGDWPTGRSREEEAPEDADVDGDSRADSGGHGQRGDEDFPAKQLKFLCGLIADLARGETDRRLASAGSEAAREDLREVLATVAADMAEDISLVRAECDRLRAEARQHGLTEQEAEEALRMALMRDFYQFDYQDIRSMARQTLLALEGPPVQEERLQAVCTVLSMLAIDPSGQALRRMPCAPRFPDEEWESWLGQTRQWFAQEIALLDAEMRRRADAAEARGMGDDAVRHLIEAELNHEFVRIGW